MSTDEPSRRADAQRNLVRILDAATAVLAENRDASMTELAEASGLVRATLYRHFPGGREDLLREIHGRALDEAAEAIRGAEPGRGSAPDALRRITAALLEVGDRFRIVVEHTVEVPELLPRAEAAIDPLAEVIARGQREGSLRDDLTVGWLMGAYGGLVDAAFGAVSRGELPRADAAGILVATFLEPVATG